MKVKRLRLENINQFAQLNLALAPTETKPSNVTVLVGNNGSGKSSIIKTLAIGLSDLVTHTINRQDEVADVNRGDRHHAKTTLWHN